MVLEPFSPLGKVDYSYIDGSLQPVELTKDSRICRTEQSSVEPHSERFYGPLSLTSEYDDTSNPTWHTQMN